MAIKPVDVVAHWKRGLVQPGIKCRGPEYLRIIYGAEHNVLPRRADSTSRANLSPPQVRETAVHRGDEAEGEG